MKKLSLLLLFFVQVQVVTGQNRVTFQLDLDPLLKEQRFLPEKGHRVFIRGSFNQWQGDGCELFRQEGGGLYTGSFELEGKAGDTIAYKYVIEKGPGRVFWEGEADPASADHGNRRLVLQEEDQVLPAAIFHCDAYFDFPVIFTREQLQADFKQFRAILEDTHPALYDYTEKRVLDSLFEQNYAAIQGDMEFRDFLMLMTGVISQVGCGHSSLWIPGSYWNVAPAGLFPLKLLPSGKDFFVSGSFADTLEVPVGSVILSINGMEFKEITDRLEFLTSSDGLIQAFRRAKVAQHFAQKYALAYGFPEAFHIRYLSPDSDQVMDATLLPISKVQLDQGMQSTNELSMKELAQGQVALLTINSFAYYSEVPMFRSFIDSCFQVIDQKGIDRLIMDLRGNGGGDPFCASYLWGYLQHSPVPYFEDHYGRYDTLANPIPLPANHYEGRLFTLADGLCFSTTGHFCGLLKYHRLGEFVGSETGATYTCTGNATYPALDETGIMVGTARVMRYTAAVKGMDPTTGILPDHPVEPTQEDLISGRDRVLEYALSLATGH